jgi:hypothetical protein
VWCLAVSYLANVACGVCTSGVADTIVACTARDAGKLVAESAGKDTYVFEVF